MIGRKQPFRELEKHIGYRFRKKRLLEAALTHRSFRFESAETTGDNQRLEFLGDAVLGFVTAAHLYREFSESDEGVLTSFRSQLTSGRALGRIGKQLGLGAYLRVGKGEARSGGQSRRSNLADALEALIGAAYLDGGLKAAETVFRKVLLPEVDALSGDVWRDNPKGKLQEWTQRRWRSSPRYRLKEKHGPAHAAKFTVEVVIEDGRSAVGTGTNKQAAESDAAGRLLKQLRGSAPSR